MVIIMKNVYCEYINFNGAKLFTVACIPEKEGEFPTVIFRSPYVDDAQNMTEEEICNKCLDDFGNWLKNGYAVVFQHCRGSGKSSGDCIPYIYEREDGIRLHNWIREQSFYNGELYLCGSSYTASVHFVTFPFAEDIKGAVLEVQDCERYNCNYRNGFYKMGLHGGWYVDMYKKKSITNKNFTSESYKMLPLALFSKKVLGEPAEDFDEILMHPDINDMFWQTRFGGCDAHDAIKYANFPILLVTGFYDIYTGGVFDMWKGLSASTRSKSALAVHPYEHGGSGNDQPITFENGRLWEAFGDYQVKWINYIRGKGESPFEVGKVTYYKLFGNKWCCDEFIHGINQKIFKLGKGVKTYCYDPNNPATFKGGLSDNFGGNEWQDSPGKRDDILSFYTPEFTEDVFVKGKMSAKLMVKSDCEDTCFYIRISLAKAEGDYGLRDDINQISNFCDDYIPGNEIEMDFSFNEHAFVIKKGERLRIDISSSAYGHYVCHTNYKGLFSAQTKSKIANNSVILDKSYISIPTEE